MAKSLKEEFTKGIIKENPVLRLMLGTCATLAVTTAASNAIGMGLATTFVLVCSNAVISLLKKIIPDKVRIPAYITIVAGFVTIVQLLAALVLILIVLFQSGKSQGLSGAIGGIADSYMSKGKARTIDAKLAKATKWVGAVFVILTLVLDCMVAAGL